MTEGRKGTEQIWPRTEGTSQPGKTEKALGGAPKQCGLPPPPPPPPGPGLVWSKRRANKIFAGAAPPCKPKVLSWGIPGLRTCLTGRDAQRGRPPFDQRPRPPRRPRVPPHCTPVVGHVPGTQAGSRLSGSRGPGDLKSPHRVITAIGAHCAVASSSPSSSHLASSPSRSIHCNRHAVMMPSGYRTRNRPATHTCWIPPPGSHFQYPERPLAAILPHTHPLKTRCHPAKGAAFYVRLAGGPFFLSLRLYLLVPSFPFGILGFCPHPEVGHPREAVNGPPDSKPTWAHHGPLPRAAHLRGKKN
jgi:hypothetical protein